MLRSTIDRLPAWLRTFQMSIDSFSYNGRSDFGNYFFFLLPFINLNYYAHREDRYGYINIGWLIFTITWTFRFDVTEQEAQLKTEPVDGLPF